MSKDMGWFSELANEYCLYPPCEHGLLVMIIIGSVAFATLMVCLIESLKKPEQTKISEYTKEKNDKRV